MWASDPAYGRVILLGESPWASEKFFENFHTLDCSRAESAPPLCSTTVPEGPVQAASDLEIGRVILGEMRDASEKWARCE